MWNYLSDLLWKSLQDLPTAFGQTWLSVFLLLIPPVLVWVVRRRRETGKWTGVMTLPTGWSQGIKDISISVGVWLILLLAVLAYNVLSQATKLNDEHKETIAVQQKELKETKDQLKTQGAELIEAKSHFKIASGAAVLLQETNAKLEREIKALRESTTDASLPKPFIEISRPAFRTPHMLVIPWKITGYAEANISSVELSLFLGGKLYQPKQQLMPKPSLAIPYQGQIFEIDVPATLPVELEQGISILHIVMEWKYTGQLNEKYTRCYESQYDKNRKSFTNISLAKHGCSKQLKKL